MDALTHFETVLNIKTVDNNITATYPHSAPFVPFLPTNTDPNLATKITTADTTTATTETTTATTTNNTDTTTTTTTNNDTEVVRNNLLLAKLSVVEACIQKTPLENFAFYDDRLMHCLLQLFNVQGESCHLIYEDSLLAISAVVEKFGARMTRYITNVFPVILQKGLANPKETTLLKISLGVVGDLCRALKQGEMVPYHSHGDDAVRRVMELLGSSEIDRTFNLAAIDLFAAMALNLERGMLCCSSFPYYSSEPNLLY